jgi:predicted GTPase
VTRSRGEGELAQKTNVIIIGAGGRDFHNFNVRYRDDPAYSVVGFTAGTQIPGIEGRSYPPELAGELYPDGIPVYPEADLPRLIEELDVGDCVFSYSDVSFQHVLTLGAIVQGAGANYVLLGPRDTQLTSTKPVVAVGAVRTGAGKSQTSRAIIEYLLGRGLRVVAVRHPMPYGNLAAQKAMRFAELSDLERHDCTVEEREEFEPHIVRGNVVYCGVDYEVILRAAEADPGGCDVIVWDGGNNDFSFFAPDVMVTVVDPLRPGHELGYWPGAVTLRLADVVVVNKVDSAAPADVGVVRANVEAVNPAAIVIEAESPVTVDDPSVIRNKRVLAIEDGPTVTHGGMTTGAAALAATKYGAAELVDPRPFLKGSLAGVFELYPHLTNLLPAQGYGGEMLEDLEATVNAVDCDAVVIGTPIDLSRVIRIDKPATRVHYELREIGSPNLAEVLGDFVARLELDGSG